MVEDEPALRRALAATLSAEGYAVEESATGRSALDAMNVAESDVVLLDLGLPDLDGIEICRQLPAVVDRADHRPHR